MGLIHHGLPLDNHPVHRDPFHGPDHDHIAFPHLAYRGFHLGPLDQDIGVLGGHLEDFFDRPAGPVRHILFQQLADLQDPDDFQGSHGLARGDGHNGSRG